MKLNYRKYGEGGTPLVILHGLFGSLDNWHTLASRFGGKFLTYSIDQRNHGKSPHDDEHNYRQMGGDLLAFLDEHELQEANLLGHSMGGKTVMQFAMSYPERAGRLIVADIAPKRYPLRHDDIIEALKSVDLKGVKSRKDAEEQLGRYIHDDSVKLFLLKNLVREDGDGYGWKMNLKVLDAKYEEMSQAIVLDEIFDKPALFVSGEKSNYVTDADREEILKHFPQAQFMTIKDAGHWLHAERPEEFYEAVTNFLWAES